MPASSLSFPPSPLTAIQHPVAEAAGVNWLVKRDDRYGPGGADRPLQGNKIRKLQGWIARYHALNDPTLPLISFGGAYSNHLAALAVYGRRTGIPTVGIVRGEHVDNPTLKICRKSGMKLHFISRSRYRAKQLPATQDHWQTTYGPGFLIPEGGSGPPSASSCAVLFEELLAQWSHSPIHNIQLAAGTGGTAAGLIAAGGSTGPSLEIFPVLKGDWMDAEIRDQLPPAHPSTSWRVIPNYHFGGYARQTSELLRFCHDFTHRTNIPLDPVYTGKLFYGVVDRLRAGHYPPGTTIVTYHSGGIY